MGYTTYFDGQFTLDRPLNQEHHAYLTAFASTRRMTRDAKLAEARPDPLRAATGLPVGEEGGYFVGGGRDGLTLVEVVLSAGDFRGQEHTSDVVDYNCPPSGQPGLWCQWIPTDDGTAIVWDDNEKFYYYIEWLQYIVEHFLTPWGYTLSGEVAWNGEEPADFGKIVVSSTPVNRNTVMVARGYRAYHPLETI